MAWVQWSLACHGGYLASQPQLVKQLTALNKVLKERASGLMPLMSLKGRLDMLQAQLDLRKRNQRRAANDDEDEAVIYVEGEDDYVSSVEGDDESVDGDTATPGRQKRLRQEVDDDDESSMDGMPTTMEMDDMSEDGSEDSEGLIDDEAEETDDDDDMSEPVSDDFEEGEGVSESEEESKPERRSTAARAGLKSRR
jgi:U3 small nucleolar RNA-associated protein 5